jgi:hypothetical protein
MKKIMTCILVMSSLTNLSYGMGPGDLPDAPKAPAAGSASNPVMIDDEDGAATQGARSPVKRKRSPDDEGASQAKRPSKQPEVVGVDDDAPEEAFHAPNPAVLVGRRWYEDNDIQELGPLVLTRRGLRVTGQSQARHSVRQGEVYFCQSLLSTFIPRALEHLARGNVAAYILNVNANHWVSIVLFQIGDQVHLVYYDSLNGGGLQSTYEGEVFLAQLQEASGPVNVIELHHQQQHNGNDCGAFSLENMAAFVHAAHEGVLQALLEEHLNLQAEPHVIEGDDVIDIFTGLDVQLPIDGSAQAIRHRHDLLREGHQAAHQAAPPVISLRPTARGFSHARPPLSMRASSSHASAAQLIEPSAEAAPQQASQASESPAEPAQAAPSMLRRFFREYPPERLFFAGVVLLLSHWVGKQ